MPLTETPPVSGPMKPTFTLSLASAAPAASVSTAVINPALITLPVLFISPSPVAPHPCDLSLMVAQPKIEGKLTKLFSPRRRRCIVGASQSGLRWHQPSGELRGKGMAHITLLCRIALGAGAALIFGAAAVAQTPTPAP